MNIKVCGLILVVIGGFCMYIHGNAFGETLLIRESTRNAIGATTYKESYYGKDIIFIDDSATPLKTLIDFKKRKVFLICWQFQKAKKYTLPD